MAVPDSVPRPLVDNASANTLQPVSPPERCSACRPAGCQPRKESRWPYYHQSMCGKNTTQSHILSRTKEYCWLVCYIVFSERLIWSISDLLPVWHCPKVCLCVCVGVAAQMHSSSSSPCSKQQTGLWSALCGLLRWSLNMISFQGKRFVFPARLAQRATLFLSPYPTLTPHSRFWVTWPTGTQTSGAFFFFFWLTARNIVYPSPLQITAQSKYGTQ